MQLSYTSSSACTTEGDRVSVFQPELGQEVETSLTREPVPPVTENLCLLSLPLSGDLETVLLQHRLLFSSKNWIFAKNKEKKQLMHFLKAIKEKWEKKIFKRNYSTKIN